MRKYLKYACMLLLPAIILSCSKDEDNAQFVGGPETANFNSGGQQIDDGNGQQSDDELDWEAIEITPEVTSDSEVKIMTFNLRVNTSEEDPQNNWSNRRKAIPVMIKTTNPTTFGVQEGKMSQITYIQTNCPEYDYVGQGNKGGTSGEFSAIFYKKDEVKLLQGGTFWLSDTPDTPSKSFGVNYYRIATWAVFEKIATGERFIHVNTHLNFEDDVQTKEMEVLYGRLKEYNADGYPGFITGDMNTQQNAPCFSAIKKDGWKNARLEARETDNSGTYNGWGASGKIIDLIWFKGIKALKYKVVTEQFVGVQYISDHYPVYGVFEFPVKGNE